MRYLLRKARVVCAVSERDGEFDILVEDGRIVEIGRGMKRAGARVIDLADRLLFPGFIDLHAHLREPGDEEKETLETGAAAALAGGFAAVVAMPNTNPPIDNAFLVRAIADASERLGLARILPTGTLTRGRAGEAMAEIGSMAAAGAVAFTDDGASVADAGLMRSIMRYAEAVGATLLLHEEDETMVAGGHLNEGEISAKLGLKGRPAVSEAILVARDLILAEETRARVHFQHVSTRAAVRLIREARRGFARVTAEVTPHHLLLTEEACAEFDTNCKVNPPLRTASDREALVEALVDGTFDAVASDHAPHLAEEKRRTFSEAPPGIAGIETAVPLIFTHFAEPGTIGLARFCEVFSVGPAHALGRSPFAVREGEVANLTAIDPTARRTVDPDSFLSKGRNTPFAGWELTGWPCLVFVDGDLRFLDGRVVRDGEEEDA